MTNPFILVTRTPLDRQQAPHPTLLDKPNVETPYRVSGLTVPTRSSLRGRNSSQCPLFSGPVNSMQVQCCGKLEVR
jgi:hypothetical protein